jgi:hypothetical protein
LLIAEARLNTILASKQSDKDEPSLAEEIGNEADLENLRTKVLGLETAILGSADDKPLAETKLRRQLSEIATAASRVVSAQDNDKVSASTEPESLFDRVQRFADQPEPQLAPVAVVKPKRKRPNAAAKRIKALNEIQSR